MVKFLVLGVLIPLCAGTLCPSGKFWSHELDECILCSKCEQSYLLKPCEKFNDTVCADEIKLSLDWLHPKHHLKKDRLHFIRDDDEDDDYDDDEEEEEIEKKKLHHHKEFNDLDDFGSKKVKHYSFGTFDDEDKEKHKKHKKHYSFGGGDIVKKNHRKKFFHKHWKNSDFDDDEEARLANIRDEHTLEEWLIDSRNKLKHKQDDLLKTLKVKHEDDNKKFKLNHPNSKVFTEIIDDLVKHELHTKKEKNRLSPSTDLFRDLVKSDRHKDDPFSFMKLLSNPDGSNSLDYKSVVPTHRMFLGEPSTVSEIIGQDPQDSVKSDYAKNVVLEKSKFSVVPFVDDSQDSDSDVLSVPFSSAETLVWDWQAVSLVSAVGACLLFFVVAGIYILLSARETKRVKISDHDAEEMTTMVALMPPELEKSDERRKHPVPRPIVIPKQGHTHNYIHKNSGKR